MTDLGLELERSRVLRAIAEQLAPVCPLFPDHVRLANITVKDGVGVVLVSVASFFFPMCS